MDQMSGLCVTPVPDWNNISCLPSAQSAPWSWNLAPAGTSLIQTVFLFGSRHVGYPQLPFYCQTWSCRIWRFPLYFQLELATNYSIHRTGGHLTSHETGAQNARSPGALNVSLHSKHLWPKSFFSTWLRPRPRSRNGMMQIPLHQGPRVGHTQMGHTQAAVVNVHKVLFV